MIKEVTKITIDQTQYPQFSSQIKSVDWKNSEFVPLYWGGFEWSGIAGRLGTASYRAGEWVSVPLHHVVSFPSLVLDETIELLFKEWMDSGFIELVKFKGSIYIVPTIKFADRFLKSYGFLSHRSL